MINAGALIAALATDRRVRMKFLNKYALRYVQVHVLDFSDLLIYSNDQSLVIYAMEIFILVSQLM